MGNEQNIKQLKTVWEQDPVCYNLFKNKETNEIVRRTFIDGSSEKQYTSFKKRMEDNNPRACKIVYAYNSSTGLNLICAFVEEFQYLKVWNYANVLDILKGMKLLKQNYGPFKITAQMVRQDKTSQVKVWLNKNTTENIPQLVVDNQGQMFSSFLIMLKNKNKQIYKQLQFCDNFDKAIKFIYNSQKKEFKDEISKKEYNSNQYRKLFVEPKIAKKDRERFNSLLKFNKPQSKKIQTLSPKFQQKNQQIQGLQLIQSKSIYLKSTQNFEDQNINDRIKSQSNLSHFKKSYLVRQINQYQEKVIQQSICNQNIKQIEQLQAGLQKLKNNLRKEEKLTKRNKSRAHYEVKYKPDLKIVPQKNGQRYSNLLAKVKSIPVMVDIKRQKSQNKYNLKRQLSPPSKASIPRQLIQRNQTSDFNELRSINKQNFCPHRTLGTQIGTREPHRRSDLHLFLNQKYKEDKIKQKVQAKNQFFAQLKLEACKILD